MTYVFISYFLTERFKFSNIHIILVMKKPRGEEILWRSGVLASFMILPLNKEIIIRVVSKKENLGRI